MGEDVGPVIEEDIKKGLIPIGIVLTYGTTNTCGYDAIGAFQELKEKHNLWIHIDAAYAGAALILPERQGTIGKQILETITSFNVNAAKWFMAGFDSTFLFVADRRLLISVMSATGNYMSKLENTSPYAPEFKDWGLVLGRKDRALRIWLLMSYFGVEGLQEYLRSAITCADALRGALAARPNIFRIPVRTDLGLVCFQLLDQSKNEKKQVSSKERHQSLCDHLRSANFFVLMSDLTQTGEPMIRVALGGVLTDASHVEDLFSEIENFLEERRWVVHERPVAPQECCRRAQRGFRQKMSWQSFFSGFCLSFLRQYLCTKHAVEKEC